MPTLRQRLKRPETYLAALALVVLLAIADTYRSPANQITGQLYISAVHFYQALGRPLLEGRIRCRYTPTCSEYSIEAVREHGIRQGLVLSVSRLQSCTNAVPMGTVDPVPTAHSPSPSTP